MYPRSVSRTNKFLADANKTPVALQMYKAFIIIPEPSSTPTPLIPGGSAAVLDLFFMDSKNKLIAVVDDDAGVRQSLERLLNLVGYTVRTFADAVEFLDSIVKDTAHCVVIDVNLGVSSGLDLADHPLVAGGKIPVIFISGAVEDRVRTRANAAGCVALLSKPFKPVELLDAIFRATQGPIPVS